VNIVGVGGRTGNAEFAIGGAVNAALLNLTKVLADRGVRDGVRVNAINPGSIRTDRLQIRLDRFAAEHVNIQTKDDKAVLDKVVHAGAVFVGPYSPVAAGDYVAGPSHCLPTNTTARFSSGISVYEFLKRSSIVRYTERGLSSDSAAIVALANAEHLDGHAASVRIRRDGVGSDGVTE